MCMATSCKELTHWKRLWCWEGLGVGGEGDDRGWNGWMASPTRWTWIWVNSWSWPGVLRFMGSQRVGHDWVTELNWTELMMFEKKNSWKDKTMQYLLVEQILWGYEFLDFYFQDKHCVSHSVGTDSLQPHGLFATYQAPLSMEFSRKESWGWLLCHSTGDLSTPGIKLWSPEFQADSLLSEAQGKHIFRRIVYELMPLGYGKLRTN